MLIVIVDETDKILSRFAVRRNLALLRSLAIVKDLRNRLYPWRIVPQRLDDRRQLIKQRIIQRRINAEALIVLCIASHKLVDQRLLIVDLAEGEEVPLPRTQRKLPHRIPEGRN